MSAGGGRPNAAAVIWNAGKILLVFGAAGPLVGLVVFATGLSVMTMAGGQSGGAWLAPFFLLYGLPFAHFIGLPWALVAGGAATALSYLAGKRAWIGVASGVVSFAVATVSGNASLPVGPEGAVFDRFDTSFFGLIAVVHVLSATACWLIARPLIRDRGVSP